MLAIVTPTRRSLRLMQQSVTETVWTELASADPRLGAATKFVWQPHWQHDCDSCMYLGTVTGAAVDASPHDLYYAGHRENRCYVLYRFGSFEEQYISMMDGTAFNCLAYALAIKMGYLQTACSCGGHPYPESDGFTVMKDSSRGMSYCGHCCLPIKSSST